MATGASMPFFARGVEEAASGRKITVLVDSPPRSHHPCSSDLVKIGLAGRSVSWGRSAARKLHAELHGRYLARCANNSSVTRSGACSAAK
jgi:hypothetical protein